MYGLREDLVLKVFDQDNYQIIDREKKSRLAINACDLKIFKLISLLKPNRVAKLLKTQESKIYSFISYYHSRGLLEKIDNQIKSSSNVDSLVKRFSISASQIDWSIMLIRVLTITAIFAIMAKSLFNFHF